MSTDIICEVRDRVLHIEFNRPKKKNALTVAMYGAMSDALESADKDDNVRVAVFRGTDGCFTSGNDIGDFMKARGAGDLETTARFLQVLAGFSKPVVAQVDGVAIGIGTTLLLHCDLVYATERARLKMPFVDLGVVPEFASSLLLPRLLGYQRTCELLLLGEELSGPRAHDLGLVNEVVAVDKLDSHVAAKIERLVTRAPGALRATKALLKAPVADGVKDALVREGKIFGERIAGPEAVEAFTAFMQRRPADFSKF